MLYFPSIGEASEVFKALSAPARLKIMEMIYENDNLSMNDLAEALKLTNGAISMHVGKLEEAGLVKIRTSSGKRGTMKIVKPCHDRIMIDMAPPKPERHCYVDDIRVAIIRQARLLLPAAWLRSSTPDMHTHRPALMTFPHRHLFCTFKSHKTICPAQDNPVILRH